MYEVKDALILDVSQGVYEGTDWQSIICRINDHLVKFKVDKKKITFSKDDLDKTYTLKCDLYGSATNAAVFRVIGYSE